MYCRNAVEQSTLTELDIKTTTNYLPAATRMTIVYWCVVHMPDSRTQNELSLVCLSKQLMLLSSVTISIVIIVLLRLKITSKNGQSNSEAVQSIDEFSWQNFWTRVQRKTLQSAELKLFPKQKQPDMSQ